MPRLAMVLILVGCGGATSTGFAQPAKTGGVPATYAKLFQQGSKWMFATATTHATYDGEKSTETTGTGTLACEVMATSPRPGGSNTRLECKATPELPTPFPKELVATSTGLWELIEGRELKEDDRLITEPPNELYASATVHAEAEGSMGRIITNKGARWCFGESQAMQGQTSSWTVCVRDGDFVGGTSQAGGGDLTTLTWGDHD